MQSTRKRVVALGFAAGLLTLGLAACGDDDGGEVRSADGDSSGAGSASASGSASGSAPGSASASASGSASGMEHGSASGVAECQAVGTDLEGDAVETVDITLDEYAFDPSTVSVAAGVVTFATSNAGEEHHELAFLPGGGDVPLTEDGAPDEEALAEAGAFELEAYGPGGSCNATYDLEPGTYTMFCIVEAEDGETHASKGMVGELTVT
jgi:plastocyanin